jgi:hypothetical protein
MEERKYCRECGSKLQIVLGTRFDQYTGEKITFKSCVNLKCQDGCGNVTGHSKFSCWRNKCLGCGFVQIDY